MANTKRKKKRSIRGGKRTYTKGFRISRKTQRQILIAMAIIVGIIILLSLIQKTPVVQKKLFKGEIGKNVVYGNVTGVAIGIGGKGTISVKSFNTGKTYTFYTGVRTRYNVRRYPQLGDKAKVYYFNDRGYLKAWFISIR